MAAPKMLDLQEMLEKYAWGHYKDLEDIKRIKHEFRGLDKEDVEFEINMKKLIIQHGEPNYVNLQPGGAKPYTLFKTVFTNNTDRQQEYSFRTERSTESVCLICREQGYTIGQEAEISLKTPCEVMEFKAGFKHEMSFAKGMIHILRHLLKHHLSKFSSKREVKAGFCPLHRDPALSAGSLCSGQNPAFTSLFDENLDR